MRKAIIHGTATALMIYFISFGTLWLSCDLLEIPHSKFGIFIIIFSALLGIVVGAALGSDENRWGKR